MPTADGASRTSRPDVAVVIPTLGRERVLCDTIEALVALPRPPDELIVVDQTTSHEAETEARLQAWTERGYIRWIRQSPPSIPAAMNRGLLDAHAEVVLYLDDDIVPDVDLVAAHAGAWQQPVAEDVGLIAGRVVQPWDDEATAGSSHFSFAQRQPAWIEQFMGGNFSVRRAVALELGGFDESFVGAAYRFEADFADRMRRGGYRIRFDPRASLHHLHAGSGGTRSAGHHLRTWRPHHAVGAYYYLMRSRPPGWLGHMLARPWRSVRTRHHLSRPWWIVPTLVAETRGWWKALRLRLAPPRTLSAEQRRQALESGQARPDEPTTSSR